MATGIHWAFIAFFIGAFLMGVSSTMAVLSITDNSLIAIPLQPQVQTQEMPNTDAIEKLVVVQNAINEPKEEVITYPVKEPEKKEKPKQEIKVSNVLINHPSPKDRIDERDVQVLSDRIIIKIDNPKWAKFTATYSMDPVFDTEAHALQIQPRAEKDLQVGDIISYASSQGTIIHRIIEISTDKFGWYAYTKGDNNPDRDPDKVRFRQIKKVVIGILY